MAAPKGDERLVLLYFRDPKHWVLLTTEQVVTWQAERVLYIPWDEIENATVDAAHLNEAMTSSPDGKLALERLSIVLRTGGSVELEVEAGAAFFGFWNVLKMVASLTSDGSRVKPRAHL